MPSRMMTGDGPLPISDQGRLAPIRWPLGKHGRVLGRLGDGRKVEATTLHQSPKPAHVGDLFQGRLATRQHQSVHVRVVARMEWAMCFIHRGLAPPWAGTRWRARAGFAIGERRFRRFQSVCSLSRPGHLQG